MSKPDCEACHACYGNGRCALHRKKGGSAQRKPCKTCGKPCVMRADLCRSCHRATIRAGWHAKPRRSIPVTVIAATPPSQIPGSRNPKPHRDWATRMERELLPKRPPRPVVIQDGTKGGEQAFPKREAVAVSKAPQGSVVLW